MYERAVHQQTSSRRQTSRAWPGARLARGLAGLLAFATVACQSGDTTITTLDDAATARIGVMAGSTGEQIVLQRFPNADIRTFDDIMDAVSAIRAEQLDAVVTAFPGALQVTKRNPDLTLVTSRCRRRTPPWPRVSRTRRYWRR